MTAKEIKAIKDAILPPEQHGRTTVKGGANVGFEIYSETALNICLTQSILSCSDIEYHNVYAEWSYAARKGQAAQSIDLNREDGRDTDTNDADIKRASDCFHLLCQRMNKEDIATLDIVCQPLPSEYNPQALRSGLAQLAGNIDRVFRKLQKEVDDIKKQCDSECRQVTPA